MKTLVNKITKGLLTYLLISALGLMLVNNFIFTHTHKMENGAIITHAHPFDKGNDSSEPFKSHHHNKNELLFYASFELLFAVFLFTSILIKLPEVNQNIYSSTSKYSYSFIRPGQGRAPPIV